jgi:putative membrane protein
MIHIAIKVLSIAAALLLVARFIPGISIDSFTAAFFAALILGALNVSVKPLLAILTFPITFLTFGLFSFVLNAAMFGLAAYMVPGFAIAGFIPALLGSFIVTVVSTLAYRILT